MLASRRDFQGQQSQRRKDAAQQKVVRLAFSDDLTSTGVIDRRVYDEFIAFKAFRELKGSPNQPAPVVYIATPTSSPRALVQGLCVGDHTELGLENHHTSKAPFPSVATTSISAVIKPLRGSVVINHIPEYSSNPVDLFTKPVP